MSGSICGTIQSWKSPKSPIVLLNFIFLKYIILINVRTKCWLWIFFHFRFSNIKHLINEWNILRCFLLSLHHNSYIRYNQIEFLDFIYGQMLYSALTFFRFYYRCHLTWILERVCIMLDMRLYSQRIRYHNVKLTVKILWEDLINNFVIVHLLLFAVVSIGGSLSMDRTVYHNFKVSKFVRLILSFIIIFFFFSFSQN